MKDQKGVTLTSLIIYVVVLLIVIVILGVIRNNFQNGVREISEDSLLESEFNKFNIYFLKDIKKIGNTVVISNQNKRITFSSGNIYEFNDETNSINLINESENQEIKLLEKINSCTFSKDDTSGKTIITVLVTFSSNTEREISKAYVLAEGEVGNVYQNEEDYIDIKEDTNTIEENLNTITNETVNETVNEI